MTTKGHKRVKDLTLKPVEMTQEVMQELEDRGLIYRIRPGGHELSPKQGETLDHLIYECTEKFGPHKLISVTVNRKQLSAFGAHPETEDFLLLGDPDTKPLYLVIALCMKDELLEEIREKSLSEKDFITLRVKYNDPEVSFFSMLKDVPHGEAVGTKEGRPPSFYVTESRDLPIDIVGFNGYELKIAED